jgi:hypothetical protein
MSTHAKSPDLQADMRGVSPLGSWNSKCCGTFAPAAWSWRMIDCTAGILRFTRIEKQGGKKGQLERSVVRKGLKFPD